MLLHIPADRVQGFQSIVNADSSPNEQNSSLIVIGFRGCRNIVHHGGSGIAVDETPVEIN